VFWRSFGTALTVAAIATLSIGEAKAANISSTASGNWNAGGTWVGGVPPVAGDNVTIASGHTVTVTAGAACATITVAANAGASSGIIINSGILLNVSGAITMTSPTVVSNPTISVGGGSLNAASIAIPGSAIAGRNCIVSVNNGTVTVTGNITFSGSAARAQLTSTGAGTINIGGNLGSGGTLTTGGTGTINFNGGAAQTMGTYTTYNNVSINNTSGGVTLTGTTTIGGTLTVTTGTLTMGAFTSTVTGATSVSSTLTISSTTGTKTFGDLTINTGGTMSFTAAANITENGSVTANGTGTISGTAGTWTLQKAGGGGTIGGTAASISLTNATFTTSYTLGTALSTTNLTLSSGTFAAGSNAITIAGNFTNNATFTEGTSAVTMTGAAKTIGGSTATNFYDLTISGTGSVAAGVAMGIDHNLTVSAAGSFNASTFAITGNGTNTLTVSGTLGAGAATFATNYVSFETETLNSGSTIDYTGAGAQTVDNTISYLSLAHSGTGTATAGGNLTIAENLTVSAGTLDLSTFTANRSSSGGTLTVSGGTLKIGGTNGIPSNYTTHTFPAAGTIEYGGTNQTISVESYGGLAVSGSGTKTMAGALTLTGSLTLTSATLSTGTNYNLTIAGNWTNNGGTLSAGTSTVTFTGNGKTISGTNPTTFATVVIRGGANYTMSNNNSCTSFSVTAAADINPCSFTQSGASALTVNGNASVVKLDDLAATWSINAGSATISGNLTLSATGSNQAPGIAQVALTTGTLTISGNLIHSNALSAASTVVNMSGAATVNLAGAYTVTTLGTQTPGTTSVFNYNGSASAQTVSFASAITYADLYLNNTNAGGATLGAAVTAANVVGDLQVQSGQLSNGGFAVAGNAGETFSVANGATYVMTSTTGMVTGFGTHTFGATSTCNYAGTAQTVSNESYGNLTLSGSGTKTMPSSSLAVAGNFTMSGTASATAAAAMTVSGNFSIGSTAVFGAASFGHSIAGNVTTDGTFTASTSTFTLNGSASQSVSGASAPAFNNLTINNASGISLSTSPTVNGTLTFTSGNITTAANKVIISSTGSVSRTSGYVVGNLQKYVPAGSSVPLTYEVGDAGAYAPVNLTFASVSVAGNLTASTTHGDHPNIGTSDIDPSKTANRYWTLSTSGLTYTTYGATFNFVSADLDAGANPITFSVRRYAGGTWSNMSVGTCTSTASVITGASAVGDFQCGNVPSLTVSASNTVFAFGSQPNNTWLTPQSSVLTNDGSVTENIAVQISVLTDGSNSWTISPTTNGVDQIRAQWSTTSSGGPWTDIAAYATNFTVASGLSASGNVTFYFRIQSPTTTPSSNQHSATLTVIAQ